MVSAAQAVMAKGNVAFKSQKYDLARGHYADAMLMEPSEYVYPLNRSMAYLKLERWAEAEDDATTAIRLAYFRRSVARREQADFLGARQDIESFANFGGSQKCVEEEIAKIVGRKVNGLLNKLTMENFDPISDKIIALANRSDEKEGRTFIQVVRLVFEKATDEATCSEMYARLCKKMMAKINSKVQDDGIMNAERKPFAGSQLPTKAAWAKGPPQNTSNAPLPRSQSPFPNASATNFTHSRRASNLGQGVPIKDGVSMPCGDVGAVKQGSAVTFGSIDDIPAPIASLPAGTPSIKAEVVKSFGIVPTSFGHVNGNSLISTSSRSSTITSTSTPITGPKTAINKVNVAKLFQTPGSSSAPALHPPSDTASPSVRTVNLPSQPQQHQPRPVPVPIPGWPGYFYPEHYMQPYSPGWYVPQHPLPHQHQPHQHHPPPGQAGPPQHSGMPMSPRHPPPPLQQPGTPTQSHAMPNPIHTPQPSVTHSSSNSIVGLSSPPPTPLTASGPNGARLNTNASAFVPKTMVTIKNSDGTELDLGALKKERGERERKEKEEESRRKAEEEEKEKARVRKEEEEEEKEGLLKARQQDTSPADEAGSESDDVREAGEVDAEIIEMMATETKETIKLKELRTGTTTVTTTAPLVSGSRRRPPLDLSYASKANVSAPLPSALATARIIDDLGRVQYLEGVKSPKVELNINAKDGKFRYDRDFHFQFMSICTEKPDMLPPLDTIGLESSDQAITRGGSGRHRQASTSGGLSAQPPVGLGFNAQFRQTWSPKSVHG